MMSRVVRFKMLPWFVLVALLAAYLPATARAADALKDDSALSFVPADVAFYTTGLRQREQFDTLVNSKAFAKLSSMPAINMVMFMARAQWDNPQQPQLAQFKQALQDPANQQLVEMLKDMVSNEVFFYGEPGFGEAIGLLNELNTASNAGQFEALAAGDAGSAGQYQARKVLEVLEQKGDQLKVPTSVLGFKLTGNEAATAQLKRLEGLLNAILAQQPALQQRFTREDLGGTSYLTLRLDGSLVPWQQLPLDDAGVDPEQIQKLVELLKGLKITISLGVRDNYLLVSIGEDNKHLGELGEGDLLIDRDELAVLRDNAEKPLVGIGYASGEFMKALGSMDRQMDQMTTLAKQFMPMAPISPDLQQELISDLEALSNYVKANAPEAGTSLTYSFITAAGYETFSHSWGENKSLDPSQKLTILEHLGGNPLAFFAARGKTSDDYDQIAKVVERVAYYAEQIGLQQIDDEQQAAYEKLKEKLMPLLERLVQVTRDKLVPAFEDGQGAFVLDAKSTSASWHAALPSTGADLPMLEIGLVYGVSDSGMVKEACTDYYAIVQEVLDTLHEASTGDMQDVFPNEIPKIELAAPLKRDVSNGTIYYYTFPAESGLDKQIALNAGLSDDTMVLSLMPLYSKRLLGTSSLQGQGPLANLDRPLAAAGCLNFAGLIEAVEPWIDYGAQLTSGGGGGAQAAGWVAQVKDVLEVVKCFRGVSAATYQDGDAMVTHLEWRFEDLK